MTSRAEISTRYAKTYVAARKKDLRSTPLVRTCISSASPAIVCRADPRAAPLQAQVGASEMAQPTQRAPNC